MKSKFLLVIMILLVQTLACNGLGIPVTGIKGDIPSTDTPNVETSNVETSTSIGTVLNIRTQVYAGEPNNLHLIDGETELGNDEYVKVEDGGKARLTFPGPVNLLLYNQTEMDEVRLEFDQNSNPRIINRLIRGGFSGYVQPGNHLTINLSFGVQVNVLGTNFFIIYDDVNGYITIGKFDGTLTVTIPGQDPIFIGDTELFDINSKGIITYQSSFPFNLIQFDRAADQCISPMQGFNILRKASTIPQPGKSTFQSNIELSCDPLIPLTITPTLACETPRGFVTAKVATLRDGPDVRYFSVGQYQQNEDFTVLGRYKEWFQVEFPDGQKGWLYKDWITIPSGTETQKICEIPFQGSPPTPKPPKCRPSQYVSCPPK